MNAIYKDLENKKVLITGATRGIGKDIALSLSAAKAHVIFNYRGDESQAIELCQEFKLAGASKVTSLKFDMTDYEAMKSQIDLFIKDNGSIDGLINNAGVSKDQLGIRVKEADIDFLLGINLKSTMMLTNHLYKNFLRATNPSIVNMSSVVGMMGNTAQTTYAASKAGLIGYSKSLAKELASKKVRVNTVAPGFISTEMTKDLADKAKDDYLNKIPLKEFGETNDVANLVLFLLSSASKYITGEVIKVDGGLYI
jgi:3-oxoacyl-[acyl-carrier protein] reductase